MLCFLFCNYTKGVSWIKYYVVQVFNLYNVVWLLFGYIYFYDLSVVRFVP